MERELVEQLAGRLCEWDRDGEPPVPLMQEAARTLRALSRSSSMRGALERARTMLGCSVAAVDSTMRPLYGPLEMRAVIEQIDAALSVQPEGDK